MNSHLPIVEYLISKGANINAQDKNGWTPLHHVSVSSSLNGRTDIVTYLLYKGANKKAENLWGEKPYILASNAKIRNILK